MKKLKILGLDFETQDAVAKTTNVTEVGAILYEYDGVGLTELERFSSLCWDETYPPQTEKIVELTGITDEMLKSDGKPREVVFEELVGIACMADVIFAHKISFDKVVFESTCKLVGLQAPIREWVCTLTNFPWNKTYGCMKLSHLAYEHGIMVDPRTLHRAIDDVALMMRTISLYSVEEILAYARKPWIYLRAEVCGPWTDGGTQNGIAKEHGFSYEQVKGVEEHKWPKTWVRRVKEASEEQKIRDSVSQSLSPFRIKRIEGLN